MLLETYDLLKFAWPALRYHPALSQTKDVELRLGILVLSLGEKGDDFLKTLRLPKHLSHEIHAAWRLVQEKKSPLTSISAYQSTLIKYMCPDLPPSALEPCFIHGRELQSLGLLGRRISGALNRVRRAQWEGTVSNREDAVKLIS